MERLYHDLIQPDTSYIPTRTTFTLLTETKLAFDYRIQKDGTCIADQDQSGIEIAEQFKLIKIIKRDIPGHLGRFKGNPEPFLNGQMKFVQPCKGSRGIEGEDLELKDFGAWKCLRCGDITIIPIESGKILRPFECFNDVCGRKGPFKEQFPLDLVKPVWKLPLSPIETTGIEVFNSIYEFCKKYLFLKADEYYLLTIWIMASWLVDDFQTCPYLCMLGPKSSGKTKVLEVLGELAYRSVSAISITPPALFRAIEAWHITLLIDEAELQIKYDTESGQALYGCLNGGYKRGSFALRIEGDANNRVPAAFDVFGFKAISSTKLFHPTLESRSILINMTQGKPNKIMINPEESAIIRSKLLFWRFETLGKLPIIEPNSSIGRLIEMFIPLYTTAQTLKDSTGVKTAITYLEMIKLLDSKITDMEDNRIQEESGSTEARVIEEISILREQIKNGYEERDYIKITQIADGLGWDDPKASQKIGYILKEMGVKTRRMKHGTILSLSDPVTIETLRQLEERYLSKTRE